MLQLKKHLALIALLVSWHLPSVSGQVTATFQTLESRIVEAESVFRGTIIQLQRRFIRAANVDGLPSLSGDLVEFTFTVQVRESFKGDPGPTMILVRETYGYDKRLPDWHSQRTSVLWFVGPGVQHTAARHADANRFWSVIRLGKQVPAEDLFKQDAPPIFSMDLSVLRTSRSMLRSARQFTSRYSLADKNHVMTIPHVLAEKCSASGDANFLILPVLPPLEQIARRLILSPADFISRSYDLDSLSSLQFREAGVLALRYFKSAENIELLDSLLADPTVIHHTFDFGPRKGTRVREFLIRRAAYELLIEWGEDLPKPVLETLLKPAGGGTDGCSSAACRELHTLCETPGVMAGYTCHIHRSLRQD